MASEHIPERSSFKPQDHTPLPCWSDVRSDTTRFCFKFGRVTPLRLPAPVHAFQREALSQRACGKRGAPTDAERTGCAAGWIRTGLHLTQAPAISGARSCLSTNMNRETHDALGSRRGEYLLTTPTSAGHEHFHGMHAKKSPEAKKSFGRWPLLLR